MSTTWQDGITFHVFTFPTEHPLSGRSVYAVASSVGKTVPSGMTTIVLPVCGFFLASGWGDGFDAFGGLGGAAVRFI